MKPTTSEQTSAVRAPSVSTADFAAWISSREEGAPTSSNLHSGALAFQRWYNFKEAFSPAFVADVVSSLGFRPTSCLDPFCGSGTTALTCQFLGISPTTIEVNPFVADVAEAKLSTYSIESLIATRGSLAGFVRRSRRTSAAAFPGAPASFVEPGLDGRWIFASEVAQRLLVYRNAIERLRKPREKRLLRILLGSILIPLSNVVISGKGRRYRSESAMNRVSPSDVDRFFEDAFQRALFDIARFRARKCLDYRLIRGDARKRLADCAETDLILFSPPYPNSFDYTDIYNVELWALGYLRSRANNRDLREKTLRSHVQIKRDFSTCDLDSASLDRTTNLLRREGTPMWNRNIPDMIRAYFSDMVVVLEQARRLLSDRGRIVMVVGDSRYAGVKIDVARIITELVADTGLACTRRERLRHMRSSAQQGGRMALSEWRLDFGHRDRQTSSRPNSRASS